MALSLCDDAARAVMQDKTPTGEKAMLDSPTTSASLEVHDPEILAKARALLDTCRSGKEMQDAVIAAVKRNEKWRGAQCINLLAPEAPTSPAVRALLSAEVGTRAAEGHIGKVNRWFAGTQYIDEIESLCVELLKQAFRARYADHRLVASMIGNLAVYSALTEPGDVIMSIAQPFGGHSSNRIDGPAGVRGLKIVDVPMDPDELVVDMDLFRKMAPLVRPKLIALGASMTLFPFPLKEMSETLAEWDRPGGLRMGTIEVTRLGMHAKEMDLIADFMARVLIENQSPDIVVKDVIEFRQGYQTLFYNFDHGMPPQ
jgi:glycine hydroxymethyltransferase